MAVPAATVTAHLDVGRVERVVLACVLPSAFEHDRRDKAPCITPFAEKFSCHETLAACRAYVVHKTEARRP